MKRILKEIGETMIGGMACGLLLWVLFQAATMMYVPH